MSIAVVGAGERPTSSGGALLRNLRDKYVQYRSMALAADTNPIVRIDPERVHVWGARFSGA